MIRIIKKVHSLLVVLVLFFILQLFTSCFAQTVHIDNKSIVFESFPKKLQLFPRSKNDSADVIISGYLYSPDTDTLLCRFYKNGLLISENINIRKEKGSIQYFTFKYIIHSEKSIYKFEVWIKNISEKLVISRDSIICGDVYIILGQSNSHPTNDSALYHNIFCRSFGKITDNGNYEPYDPKDTLWGIANAHGFGCRFCGDFMVGVWGLKLQELILEKYGIPTCVINVGIGGSKIEENLKNNKNPFDLNSMYGKLLYRTIKSNTKDYVKAIFWYQGEANSDKSWNNYEKNFDKFYSDLCQDFPSMKKLYLFQTRPGCDGEYQPELRNVQRNLSKKYVNIENISTTGIGFHDGCHYSLAGYYEMAEELLFKVEIDFYGAPQNESAVTPDIKKVYYLNKEQKSIGLIFNQKIELLSKENLNVIKNYFYTTPFSQEPISIYQNKDTIKIYYKDPNYSNIISYLPNKYYNNSDKVYEWPFLTNNIGIGALSFIEEIELNKIDDHSGNELSLLCYPNPAYEKVTLNFGNTNTSNIKIKINDINGKEVKEYNYDSIKKGIYEIVIPFSNLASGAYFISVITNDSVKISKVVILK